MGGDNTSKRVLFTGGTGFVGRNTLPVLEACGRFEVFAPRRAELNLFSPEEVCAYVADNAIDVVFHAANPNASKNDLDSDATLYQDSMRMFMPVYECRDLVERVVYLGSGAELDKRRDLARVGEEAFGESMPVNDYGQAKYVQMLLAQGAENVHNLRLFACFGPFDHWTKFITHCIRSVLAGVEITIRQDCRFDYLHVSDFARVIAWSLDAPLAYKDYNVGSGKSHLLSEIATMVVGAMGSDLPVRVLNEGLNREYTPNVDRLSAESGLVEGFLSLEEGIALQIAHEKEVYPPGGYDRV